MKKWGTICRCPIRHSCVFCCDVPYEQNPVHIVLRYCFGPCSLLTCTHWGYLCRCLHWSRGLWGRRNKPDGPGPWQSSHTGQRTSSSQTPVLCSRHRPGWVCHWRWAVWSSRHPACSLCTHTHPPVPGTHSPAAETAAKERERKKTRERERRKEGVWWGKLILLAHRHTYIQITKGEKWQIYFQ